MAQNVTVSHVSPMILYIPEMVWFEGTSADPDLVSASLLGYRKSSNSYDTHRYTILRGAIMLQGAKVAFHCIGWVKEVCRYIRDVELDRDQLTQRFSPQTYGV